MTKRLIPLNSVSSSVTQEWFYEPYKCPAFIEESNKIKICENSLTVVCAQQCRIVCRGA